MQVKAGSRLQSVVCDTEVIVVKAPSADDVIVGCGGSAMVGFGEKGTGTTAIDPNLADGTVLGKRYIDETTGTELLCTKPGAGTLTLDDRRMQVKDAKVLPPSD
jgi:hypothetical protein